MGALFLKTTKYGGAPIAEPESLYLIILLTVAGVSSYGAAYHALIYMGLA